MSRLSSRIRKAKEQALENRSSGWSRIGGAKTTNPYTAFLANNYGKGRVGRYSIMVGRSAVAPHGFTDDNNQVERQDVQDQPISSSIVSDGAGIFNKDFLKIKP